MRYKLMRIGIFFCIILAGVAEAQASSNYNLTWNVIGGGGGTSDSTTYRSNGTIGQSVIGFSTSTHYSMDSGYWYGIFTTILPAIRFINGTVMDSVNKTGIAGATVSANATLNTTTDATGFYSFAVTAGAYNLMAKFEPAYYVNNTMTVSTIESAVVVQDIELLKKLTGTIAGTVTST